MADHWHHDNGGAVVGAGIAGLAAGALIGGAVANQPAPVYVAPPPAPVYVAPAPEVVYDAPPQWSGPWYRYCSAKYRSFDARSGTYLGVDGNRYLCE
ncbi:BA14K family protein [Faunimonas pinastri]|nr:BA14K family protein [Faunimonas pinastri]